MSEEHPVVLVAGAINTDLVGQVRHAPQAGETVTGLGFSIFGGGKGANQAVAVARSGGTVSLVGAVGDDQFGRDRLANLATDRVNTSAVATVEGQASGVALILVETGGENRIAYIPGATTRITTDATLDAYRRVHPSLVLAPNELPQEALRSLFAAARADGVVTVFNAAPDPATALDLLPDVSILIVNEHEALEILQEPVGSHRAAAQRLADLYDLTAIVTAGADGAYASDRSEPIHIPGTSVDAVDTTGAGDTFCGAFAGELAGGASLNEAIAYGVRAAGISVTRPGAQASIPNRDEILAALRRD